MKLHSILLIITGMLLPVLCRAQFDSLKNKLLLADDYSRSNPREKIFLHIDRPYYNLKDTVWIKGYMLSALDLAAIDSSRIVYIDVLNNDGQIVKQSSTYSTAGVFFANISLPESDYKQGVYWLRTYTRFMRNFGDSLFSLTRFAIIGSGNPDWEVALQKLGVADGRFFLDALLLGATGQTFGRQEVSIQLKAKNKVLLRQNLNTGVDGAIRLDTPLPDAGTAQELQLQISVSGGFSMQVPVFIREREQSDLQFLPEGGSFVAHQLQRVGFKAINSSGRGVDVSGHIEDSQGKILASFSSIHKGMGWLWLKPSAGERYTAVLTNGQKFPLPAVQENGISLRIDNEPASDSLVVWVTASSGLPAQTYFFRAGARGVSCALGVVQLKQDPYRLAIARTVFPSGISRFTLYNAQGLPVNERAAFIWHRDTLNMELLTDQAAYGNRDSVRVTLKVQNTNAEPVIGSFSLAVLDTGRVQSSPYIDNLVSNMLLSSELKGMIEDPAYYLDNPLPEALDALLLTQGWVQYPQPVLRPVFNYEKMFQVKGVVKNLLNKPVAGSALTLFGKDGRLISFIDQSVTDDKGQFVFSDFPAFATDTIGMLIKAANKKGKQFGIGITLDIPVPLVNAARLPILAKQDIVYDTAVATQLQQRSVLYRELRRERGYLPEVIVKSRLPVKGSKNLNDGDADQVITESMMEKDAKEDLLYVLNKNVKGFSRGTFPKSNVLTYKVSGDLAIFIIDGFNIHQNYESTSPSPTAYVDYLESYLKYILAEDVVGIEVMSSPGNTFAYENNFNLRPVGLIRYTFIEITTRSGNGAFYKSLPGTYLYKPMAPVLGKTFYSPRYTANRTDVSLLDYRATVFWKPDIITNEKGEAEISFYTSDSRSGYLMIIQGTDLNGGMGVKRVVLKRKTTP